MLGLILKTVISSLAGKLFALFSSWAKQMRRVQRINRKVKPFKKRSRTIKRELKSDTKERKVRKKRRRKAKKKYTSPKPRTKVAKKRTRRLRQMSDL